MFLPLVVASAIAGPIVGANVWRIGPREGRRFRTRTGYTAMIVTAGLFIGMALVTDNWALVISGWILIAGLVSASWIDLLTHRLPRQVSYSILGAGLPFLVVAALLDDETGRIAWVGLGLLMATAIMAILYLIGRGALGAGDVRLAPTLGAFLGWYGPGAVFYGIFLGFVLTTIVSIVLLALRRLDRKDEIPMGPFLMIGTLIMFIGAAV
ncbi:MAG: prepilin peptidase [Actinomycetota bacterium]